MKIIEIEIPVYKTIKSGTKIVRKYQTEDGRIFDKECLALEHEGYLEGFKRLSTIKTIRIDSNVFLPSTVFYYIENEEDSEFLFYRFIKQNKARIYFNDMLVKNKKINQLKVGDWFTIIDSEKFEDNSWEVTCFTLDFIKNEIVNFLRMFEQSVVNI